MPWKDREKRLAYASRYRQEHREELRLKTWQYHQEHKEQRHIYAIAYGVKVKTKVFTHYAQGTPKCAYCGVTDMDILTLDHINNDGSQHRRTISGGDKLYRWLIQNDYPKGYQVLCYNCNIKKFRKQQRGEN